jgi:hypothetical protein
VRAVVLALLLAGCSSVSGWLGTNVHLVDSTWIGAERPCADGDDGQECRSILEAALRVLPAKPAAISKATLADLPTEFRTAAGEVRRPKLSRGLDTFQAMVLDLADGTREVEGFLCYVTHDQDGRLNVEQMQCSPTALLDWREWTAP